MRTAALLAAVSLSALGAGPALAGNQALAGNAGNPTGRTGQTGLPSLPGPGASTPAPPLAGEPTEPSADAETSDEPAAAPAPSAMERVKRGVVLIERDGRLLGFGTVLSGDGRILTSSSAIGAGDTADIRYSDGALVHAKVGHRDPAWDLALLVPRTVHWKDGLTASSVPASTEIRELRAPVPPRAGAKPIALPVHYKGLTDAISRQGDSLLDALDIEVHDSLPIAGAPILDQQATVVGVLVRACKLAVTGGVETAKTGPLACAPTLIGAPVTALKTFLSHTPADAVSPTPWLGIAGETDDTGPVHGVRVMAVAPQSPAMKVGLKAAAAEGGPDRIVAVDGQPVDSPQSLSDAIAKHAIGEGVKLLVLGGAGSFREVSVVLRAAP